MNSENLYQVAKEALGTNIIPEGYNPELGCAISVCVLLNKIGIDIKTASTKELLGKLLERSDLFEEVTEPQKGDIIMSATGTSTDIHNPIKHGHCGVIAKYGILSNNSKTGLWSEHWTLEKWNDFYAKVGKIPTRYFRIKK